MGFEFCNGYEYYRLFEKVDYYKCGDWPLFRLFIRYCVELIVFCLIAFIVVSRVTYLDPRRHFCCIFSFLSVDIMVPVIGLEVIAPFQFWKISAG